MPENYYCADNFFKKMTDLDSPRKNNDCYFYYYSTCSKGDHCTFRHEPSALGCETMCSFWKEGKCVNVHCNYRHMELRKNRKAIPCYWETQPGGCKKPHCPFLHQNPKTSATDQSMEHKTDSGTESANTTMTEKLSQMSDKNFKGTSVDSLVVNFEEESDGESVPTNSPNKLNQGAVKVKSLEEIKLERVQAESAAYYFYPASQRANHQQEMDDLRKRILEKKYSKNALQKILGEAPADVKKTTDITEIKVKTLDEIRAERSKRLQMELLQEHMSAQQVDENSVTSTCNDDVPSEVTTSSPKSVRRKLQREISVVQEPPCKRVKLDEDDKPAEIIDIVPPQPTAEEQMLQETDSDIKNGDSVEDNSSDKTPAFDEVLLLQDDDDNSNVSMKEEDELLNESDDELL